MSSGSVKKDSQTVEQHNKHMSGSDIEVINEGESSDSNSIEVLTSSEHGLSTKKQEKCVPLQEYDVNAHGHKPTPRSDAVMSSDNMDTGLEQNKNITCNDTVNVTPTGQNTESGQDSSSYCGEYKEISSDNEEEDDDHDDVTEKIDDEDSSTSSPSQISLNHRYVYNKDFDETSDSTDLENPQALNAERPGSLSLPRPLQFYEKHKYIKHHKRDRSDSSYASDISHSSSTDALIEEASKTPLSAQGTVEQDGDMIAFVAEGLNEMIKMSSPLSITGSSVSGSLKSPGEKSISSVSSSNSAWSEATSSASEWSRDYSRMSRSHDKKVTKKQTVSPSILTASPDDIPPVDPRALMDIELHAVKVANSVEHMLGTLQNNLSKMSALSFHCLDAHKDGVDSTCDTVDSTIKSMYALMAKCEELNKAVQPAFALHTQIKEIERLLDLFEGQLAKEEK